MENIPCSLSVGRKVLKKLFKKNAKMTNHFAFRLFQRFDIEDRRSIIREVYALVKAGNYSTLFNSGEESIRMMISNDIAVCVKMSGERLLLKTIFPVGR